MPEPAVLRTDVRIPVADTEVAAWHYPAQGAVGATPVVVMTHGLTGTRRDRLGPFAERFSRAGLAALLFDHRGFGDSGGEPDLIDLQLQQEDWRAVIAFARALPGVDPERVATFGSSMGGAGAVAAASADARVAAVISQVPMLDLLAQAHPLEPDVLARMVEAAASGTHLPAVGQPHEAALINAPGAEAGWRRVVALGEQSRWRNRASASWLLEGLDVTPLAERLHCPWLVCVGEDDLVAHPAPAIAAAQRAPRGEVRHYPGVGHFDIYDGEALERVLQDELDFLARHLLGRDRASATCAAPARQS